MPQSSDHRPPTPNPQSDRHAGLDGRRATLHDVARAAGVSVSAVSKVVRDAYGVSPQMQARVTAAIKELIRYAGSGFDPTVVGVLLELAVERRLALDGRDDSGRPALVAVA